MTFIKKKKRERKQFESLYGKVETIFDLQLKSVFQLNFLDQYPHTIFMEQRTCSRRFRKFKWDVGKQGNCVLSSKSLPAIRTLPPLPRAIVRSFYSRK